MDSRLESSHRRHYQSNQRHQHNHRIGKRAFRVDGVLVLLSISVVLTSACLLSRAEQSLGGQGNRIERQSFTQQLEDQQNAQLEAELNSLVQQHEALEDNNKLLAEAIISRLMVENLSNHEPTDDQTNEPQVTADLVTVPSSPQVDSTLNGPTGLEALKLKRILSLLQSPDIIDGDQAFSQYPLLRSTQAATMKRAASRVGNYLQQQRQMKYNGYGKNNYDFGLGKRPDSAISGNILRFGDSLSSGAQPVSQFGKRPSGHRFDFGLGKRLASPSYPRYDFGLGKRAPNRIRYDFGLGK